MTTLLEFLSPLLSTLKGLDAGDSVSAIAALSALPLGNLENALREAMQEGWLVPKEAGPHVRFGRIAKASPESLNFSIDVVVMDGPAPGAHTHLSGEFDLCFAIEGNPRFDGHNGPWVVYPPGSRHIPTVAGGKMLIVYFIPGGQIRFES
jgi:hypothetical protein